MSDRRTAKPTLLPHPRKGIYVEAAAGQYATRVGYEVSRDGRRVRSLQRLGKDPEEATIRHIRLRQEWQRLTADWPTLRSSLLPSWGDREWPEFLAKPTWITKELRRAAEKGEQRLLEHRSEAAALFIEWNAEAIEASRADVERRRAEMHDVAAGLPSMVERLPGAVQDRLVSALRVDPLDFKAGLGRRERCTIKVAKDRFLGDFQERIGKGSRYGRSAVTYNTLKRELDAALRPIDVDRSVEHLTIAAVRGVCNYWTDLSERGISGRTAENRVNAFRQFLRAMDEDESYGFRMPRGAMAAFAECKASRPEDQITPLDYDRLRAVLRCLSDECRLHLLLALNCGMYPEDISALTPEALVDEKGQPHTGGRDVYLKWRRSKTKRVNQFYAFHWLWPETVKLLDKCRAPANAHGRLLLNLRGRPLTSNEAGKGRTDTIGMNYRRRCRTAVVTAIPFLQLRKWGATAIARLASVDVQMMYRAERPKGSSNDYVLLDFVGKLQPALRDWRRELIAARILKWAEKPTV